MRCLLVTLAVALVASPALADGVLYEGAEAREEVHAGPKSRIEVCENGDPDCATRILRVLSSITFARTRLIAGPRLTPGGPEAAGALQVTASDLHMPLGDLGVGKLELVGLARPDPLRVRLTVAESEVTFFCHDAKGTLHAPLLGRIRQYCTPDAALGVGFRLLELQLDPGQRRFGARWAEVTGVLNLFGNGQGLDYVRKHVNLQLGASFETVSGQTRLRGLAGLSGLWRSPGSHWEMQGSVGYRPGLIGHGGWFGDTAAEARVTLLRHLLLTRSVLVSAGVQAEASYWQTPASSLGALASDRERSAYFVGLVVGGSFEFSDI